MSQPLVNAPQARSWREIPQPVKPRAMSREGRWRLLTSLARGTGFVTVLVGVAWGVWLVTAALRENTQHMPAAARLVPVKNFSLQTNAAGVLDATWLRAALALPRGATLMELDLESLRDRLLADGQVTAASVTRNFPDTIEVRISERAPVVRLRAQFENGRERTLLVARDGVVYAGQGYDAARLDALPWLAGVKLVRTGSRFAPIDGMKAVADLLAQAQLSAAHLYATWQIVSLERFQSDKEIDVKTQPGTVVVFGADGDFALQIAKLDYQWERIEQLPMVPSKINLALGREVPVTFEEPLTPASVSARGVTPVPARPAAMTAPAPLFSLIPPSPPKITREL
jgi:cell division protein FtsQ